MNMKVYELIQMLCEYEANANITFKVDAEMDFDGEVEVDLEGEEIQYVTMSTHIQDEFTVLDIKGRYEPEIILTY